MILSAADLEGFKKTVFRIFNKHALIERRHIRANEGPFIVHL